MTRNLVILLLLGLVLQSPGFAQDGSSELQAPSQDEGLDGGQMEYSAPYVLEAGIHVGIIAGGVNAGDQAEGRKTNADFWFLPNLGATIKAPFGAGSRVAGMLDIGYTTTGSRTRPYAEYDGGSDFSGYFHERHSYISIAPSIWFSGITLGVGFNFPTKVERWNPNQTYYADARHVVDLDLVQDMVMDFRIGGRIPAWKIDIGTLYVDISARYQFSGLYEDGAYIYGYPTNTLGDPNVDYDGVTYDLIPASASIGISYLFNLGF